MSQHLKRLKPLSDKEAHTQSSPVYVTSTAVQPLPFTVGELFTFEYYPERLSASVRKAIHDAVYSRPHAMEWADALKRSDAEIEKGLEELIRKMDVNPT